MDKNEKIKIEIELTPNELKMFQNMISKRRNDFVYILENNTCCSDSEWNMIRENIYFLNRLNNLLP